MRQSPGFLGLVCLLIVSPLLLAQSPTPRKINHRGLDSGWITAVAFSLDGKSLLYTTADADGLSADARVADVGSAREISRSERLPSPGNWSAFSADGKWFAIGTSKNRVDVRSGTQGVTLSNVTGGPFELKVGETGTGRIKTTLAGSSFPIKRAAFSPDGKLIAAATALSPFLQEGGKYSHLGGEVLLWDVETARQLHRVVLEKAEFTDVTFSPDGKLLVAGGTDKLIRVWDVASGREVRTLASTYEASVSRFSPDGRLLAVCDRGETVRVLAAESGEEVRSIVVSPSAAFDLAFSPDGRWLAIGTANGRLKESRKLGGQVRLFETATGREVRTWRADKQMVTLVAFSPDGRRVAWAGVGAALGLFETGDLPAGPAVGSLR